MNSVAVESRVEAIFFCHCLRLYLLSWGRKKTDSLGVFKNNFNYETLDELQILKILCFIGVRVTLRNFPIAANILVEMNKVLISY